MMLDSAEKCPAYVKPAQPVMRLRRPAGEIACRPGACALSGVWAQSCVLGGGSAGQTCDSIAGMRPGAMGGPPAAVAKKSLTPSSACGCDSTGAPWLAGTGGGGSPTPEDGAASGLDEA